MFIQSDLLNGEELESEICIIGGGIAGITIATEMVKSGKNIILLESGGFEADYKTQELYRGKILGQKYDMLSTRLRFFGGTSNHWEGMCMPLDELDFLERHWIPYSGWPISYNDFQKYYSKASEILELEDFSDSLPYFDSPDNLLEVKRWRFAKKLQFGSAYQEILNSSKNIKVILGANVTNIKISYNASRVENAKFSSLVGSSFVVKAKRYILSCGGIENARILLYSNDIMPAGIGNQNDTVGRYFMEHPHNKVASFYSFGKPEFLSPFIENIVWKQPISTKKLPNQMYCLSLTAKSQEQYKALNASLTISSQVANVNISDPILEYMRILSKKDKQPIYVSDFFVRSEQSPNPDSRVILDYSERDSLGLPRANLQWKLQELDWHTINTIVNLLARHLPPSSGVIKLHEWLHRKGKWPINLGWGSHHMGTTRMGDNPKTSVVDRNCKVHGMENLYIAGSSVFPTGGFANPTLTIVASLGIINK